MISSSFEEWPYNDFFFMRRCVAIWNQRGKYTPVVWEWPDGLMCPEYSKSVDLLREIVHQQNVYEYMVHDVVFLAVSLVLMTVMLYCIYCGGRHAPSELFKL
jgi:hypothetical protein